MGTPSRNKVACKKRYFKKVYDNPKEQVPVQYIQVVFLTNKLT